MKLSKSVFSKNLTWKLIWKEKLAKTSIGMSTVHGHGPPDGPVTNVSIASI